MRRMIYGLTVGLVALAAGCGGTTPTGGRQDLASGVPSDGGAHPDRLGNGFASANA